MSGYTDETVVRYVALEGATMLKKPFTKAELIAMVRQVLEGGPQRER